MNRIALMNSASPPAVITVAAWDGVSEWSPIGLTVAGQIVASTEDVTATPQVCSGWTYAGGTWTAPTPAAPAPDPDGFVAAVVASATITAATKVIAMQALAALTVAVQAGNTAQISGMWSQLITLYSISSADQAAVSALATEYGIPGITS